MQQNGFDTDTTIRKVGKFAAGTVKLTLKYFGCKLLSSLILGAISWIGFSLIKAPVPWLFAIIVGVGNAIPVVGQWISGIIVVLGMCFQSLTTAFWALLIILGLQALEEFVLSPLLIGNSLSLKPALVVIITLAAGAMFGGWGLLLAVPIAAAIKMGFEIFAGVKKNTME